jgi:hypothetical protein
LIFQRSGAKFSRWVMRARENFSSAGLISGDSQVDFAPGVN